MEKYNFISEIMREECKDNNSRQCFGKLKEYTDKIVKSSSKVLCCQARFVVGQAMMWAGHLGGNHIEQNRTD